MLKTSVYDLCVSSRKNNSRLNRSHKPYYFHNIFFIKILCVFSNLKELYQRVRRFRTILKQSLEREELDFVFKLCAPREYTIFHLTFLI